MSNKPFSECSLILACLGVAISLATPALGQDAVATFYRGRQLNLIVDGAPGGGYDAYARLLARHIGRYILGTPTVVVQDMPGAVKATDFLYAAAAKDGLTLGIVQPVAIMEPLLGPGRVTYDSTKFNFLGSANSETSLCILRSDAQVKKFYDAFSQTAVLGATGAGGSTRDFPLMLNSILGTKFKIVGGYTGTAEISLAMERGEVQGMCGQFWSSLNAQNPGWITSDKFNIIVQEALKGLPNLDQRGVPVAYRYAKHKEDEQALQLIYGPLVFGRPFVMPPSVPADRVKALRTAFNGAMKDEGLREDAEKARLPIEPVTGEAVQELVNKLYAIPEYVVQRARAAIQ